MLPRSDQIDKNVLATIKGIRKATGFQIDITGEFYDPNWPNAPTDGLAMVWVGDDVLDKDERFPFHLQNEWTPLGFAQWYRPYHIVVYLLKSQLDPIDWNQYKNIARADVEKAMMADRFRGQDDEGIQLAEDTYCDGCSTFDNANDVRGIIVKFVVKYRTAENDPYAAS